MGKGFNNYMCKKFFHPASRDNLKRVWMAEQKAESYKKKQEELRVQYEKEQDLYTNKAMLSKESKDKLSVNFMYEPPPGTKKEREREDDEPEYKFEWQRKFNAPREDYCKGDSEIRDQPFGIQVRNVRCIKCHKWGHINTDKECPMYNQSSSTDQSSSSMDPLLLVQQMREDGLAMKQSALGLHLSVTEHLPESDEDNGKLKESEIELLKSLSKKQKQKLLRKFKKLEKNAKKKKNKSKKESKHDSKERVNGRHSSCDDRKNQKVKHKKNKDDSRKKKVLKNETPSSSSSESSSDESDSSEDHHTKSKKLKNEHSRSNKTVKREKSSDSSSSDSESEVDDRIQRDRKKHESRLRDKEEELLKKKIKREKSSSSHDSSSGNEREKRNSIHSRIKEKQGKLNSMAHLERKVKQMNRGNEEWKYSKDRARDTSLGDRKRKNGTSDHFNDRDKKFTRNSEDKNYRKRLSSDSSSDGKHKSKISRKDSDYGKHKSFNEKSYRSNRSDGSSSYDHR